MKSVLCGLFAAVSLLCNVSLAHAANAPSPQATWYAAYLKGSRLVALPNGRRLNLYCIGAGSPTVLLESGIGGDAYDWRAVQDKIVPCRILPPKP